MKYIGAILFFAVGILAVQAPAQAQSSFLASPSNPIAVAASTDNPNDDTVLTIKKRVDEVPP